MNMAVAVGICQAAEPGWQRGAMDRSPDRAASRGPGEQITAAWGWEGGCSACSRGALPPPDALTKPGTSPPSRMPFPRESSHSSWWPVLCGVLGRRGSTTMCISAVTLVKGQRTARQGASAVAEDKRYSRAWGLSKISLQQPHSSAHPSPRHPAARTRASACPLVI